MKRYLLALLLVASSAQAQRIVIAPRPAIATQGDTITFTATLKDAAGKNYTGNASVVWGILPDQAILVQGKVAKLVMPRAGEIRVVAGWIRTTNPKVVSDTILIRVAQKQGPPPVVCPPCVKDTVKIQVPVYVHDTTIIKVPGPVLHDTVKITVPGPVVHDTVWIPRDTVKPPPVVVVPPDTGLVDTLSATKNFQCPANLPEAVVVDMPALSTMRVRGDTLVYTPSGAGRYPSPLVLCGPKGMIRQLMLHPERGNGVAAILNPPDSTLNSGYVVPSLTVQNGKIVAPQGASARGISQLVNAAISLGSKNGLAPAMDTTQLAYLEARDTVRMFNNITNKTLMYLPLRGTRLRTQLVENAGECWGGDPNPKCVGKPWRSPYTWMGEWPALISDTSNRSVLRVLVVPTTGLMAIPTSNDGVK